METLINIATMISITYLVMISITYLVMIVFAIIVAIAMTIVFFKFFKKLGQDMAEMEKRHNEMRERFNQHKSKHQIKL